jgi:HAD superfamily hydrolase (TIGR01509 family)
MSEALDAIRAEKCIASSNGHEQIRSMLTRVGMTERIGANIFSATEVEHGKPAPDVFLHAASRMGFAPDVCAVVEDSRFGVQAARAAGMRCFAYSGGITPSEWLAGPGTVVFGDMRKLPALLAAA